MYFSCSARRIAVELEALIDKFDRDDVAVDGRAVGIGVVLAGEALAMIADQVGCAYSVA